MSCWGVPAFSSHLWTRSWSHPPAAQELREAQRGPSRHIHLLAVSAGISAPPKKSERPCEGHQTKHLLALSVDCVPLSAGQRLTRTTKAGRQPQTDVAGAESWHARSLGRVAGLGPWPFAVDVKPLHAHCAARCACAIAGRRGTAPGRVLDIMLACSRDSGRGSGKGLRCHI